MADAPVTVQLDRASMRKILLIARESGKVVKAEVYRGIRTAAEPAAEAAKKKVQSTVPPRATVAQARARRIASRSTGLRAGIAAGVGIRVTSGANTAGVRITSSDRHLGAGQKRMNRTYNAETFRHPVFGRGSVAQHGIRWFREPIEEKQPEIQTAVLRALDDAAKKLGNL